jgi:predicted RNase H-like HicB family nuclease
MRDFSITIFYSAEDCGYIANIPALTYCSAFGDTPQQALDEVLIATAAWLATLDDVPPAPLPAGRPARKQPGN